MQIALRTSAEDEVLVIHLSGSLGRDGVLLLQEALATTREGAVVDLDELRAASPEGLTALRRLRACGHRWRNASPYLSLRLQEIDEEPDRGGPDSREAPRDEGERA